MVWIYAVAIILGAYAGVWLEKITLHLINKRVSEPLTIRFSGTYKSTIMWVLVNAAGWVIALSFGGLNPKTIEFVLLFSACVVLSAVDINIRKIPNEIVLFILAVGFIFVIINNQYNIIQANLIGLAAGFIIFFLPALIGRGAGLGDVKFAAAVGFCLGIYDFLTAILIMTLILLVYTVYIVLTGKGGLKTKIALGPFMASGFIVVMMLNILNMRHMLFDMELFLNR